jgi:hypothetical protein
LAASRAWDELAIFVEGGVDKAVAKELSHYQGECLHLHIDGRPDTIHALASFRGILQVTVEHLTPEMATAFAECECCRLSLPDLESIDADSARELSNIQCHRLILEGLKSLSANAAKELVKYGEVEEKWVSMAMPASPEESVLDAMTLMGGSTPVPRPVDDDRGIVKILRNPRMLCLEGLSESDLWDEVKEILASPKTQVVFRTELDETEWMEEREES